MTNLTQEQWCQQLESDDNAVILDVRTPAEVAEGFIPGAIKLNIQNTSDFYAKAQELDKSKNYYIYCLSGGRSGQACALFNALGIKNAYNLMGGIMAWKGELVK
ncbi:rhodanese-like domain-containing protein [Aequorivita sp. H23M31]|uniref:Rhodanese-like domain-containing protein n=1 Tax=Aequorivita ciconiae TaxID=2494375 RepID=A0A410G661_9FLAO|nr:rhodanese-like domain-containing protein [Aequorivita sp. H23M31]QAA82730.1 rhodanese-like domain-containing protein [Aequorivita sp. H23M31]